MARAGSAVNEGSEVRADLITDWMLAHGADNSWLQWQLPAEGRVAA